MALTRRVSTIGIKLNFGKRQSRSFINMLEFIKKLFGKQEKAIEERVNISELGSWLDAKSKSIFDELNSKIREIKGKIKSEVETTIHSLETLGNAELRNPKIPIREKQAMEGNREAYIKRVAIFLKQISLDGDYGSILGFCRGFDEELDKFGKSTYKTYRVLQEFFGNESREVALNIKKIAKLVKELKLVIEDYNPGMIDSVKDGAANLAFKINQKEEYKHKLSDDESKLKDTAASIDGLKSRIGEVKGSIDYSVYEKLVDKKKSAIAELNEYRGNFMHSFYILDRALRKFLRIAFDDRELLEEYMQDPIGALESDGDFRIIRLLGKVKENINSLELKDKKKEKTLQEIEKMDKDFFTEFLRKNRELKNRLNIVESQIRDKEVVNNIDRLNNELNAKNMLMGDLQKGIEDIKNEIEKISIDGVKKNLENEIKDAIKTEIKIMI